MMLRKYALLLGLALFSFSCRQNAGKEEGAAQQAAAGKVEIPSSKKSKEVLVVPFDAVAEKMADSSAGLRVINFWATWCKPCVAELPYFEQAYAKYADQGVDFTLVSLDFVEDLDKKVIPFVQKKGLKSNVWLLDDVDYNSWIDKVDPDWGGEIPMTVIIDPSRGIRHSIPQELTFEELDSIIARSIEM